MTIDEAIARERQQAKEQRNHIGTWDDEYSKKCEVYAEEHEQLAEWLEELRELRVTVSELQCEMQATGALLNERDKETRNKAIDDFAAKIKENISESLIWGMIANCFKYKNMNDTSDRIVDYVINTANEIAEQLKEGGKNEQS